MNKELHPICFYINDREEMVNQMFAAVKEDKLRAMLPPVFKNQPLDELKSSCLEALLGMSSKRIKSIVAGKEIESSSDSDDFDMSDSENHVDPAESDSDPDSDVPLPLAAKDLRSEDTLQIAISSEEMVDLLDEPRKDVPKSKKRSKLPEDVTNNKTSKCPRKSVEAPSKTVEKPSTSKHVHEETTTLAENSQSGVGVKTAENEGKTLLEIMELELRARAIRAALTHQEKILDHREVSNTGIVIEIKEESQRPKPSSKESVASKPATVTIVDNGPKRSKMESVRTFKQLGKDGIQITAILQKKKKKKKDSSKRSKTELKIVKEEVAQTVAGTSTSEDVPILHIDVDDPAEDPVLIEPVIESILISSDSEPEPIPEKQESWKERWMQKKDIASVMKANKLITTVKRQMKRKKTNSNALVLCQKEQEGTPPPPTSLIEGTVSEFNLLTTIPTADGQSSGEKLSVVVENAPKPLVEETTEPLVEETTEPSFELLPAETVCQSVNEKLTNVSNG